jgi:hypothetical protein
MVSKDPLNELSSATKELKAINKEVKDLEAGLKRVKGLVGTSLGSVKSALSSGVGVGNNMGLGVANASFSGSSIAGGSMQPMATTAKGGFGLGAISAGLNVVAAGYSALPSVADVVSRPIGFYNAAQRMPGVSTTQLTSKAFGAIQGGITGRGEDVAAANVLSLAYNMGGGKNFLQSMREVKGAALGYNMPNATAAMAIGGLHTGDMSANLYQFGISTLNVKTGKVRTMDDIAQQIYKKVYGNKRLTVAQQEFSLREGSLNRVVNDLGLNSAQQELIRPMLSKISQGEDPSLLNETGKDNPAKSAYDVSTAEAALGNKLTKPYLEGFNKANAAIVKINKSMEKINPNLLEFKSGVDTLNSSFGQAIDILVKGLGSLALLAGGVLGFKKFAKIMGGKGVPDVVAPGAKVPTPGTPGTPVPKLTGLLDSKGNPIASVASKAESAASAAGKSGLLTKLLGPFAIYGMVKSIGNPFDTFDSSKMPDPNQSFWDSVFSGTKYVTKPVKKEDLPKLIKGTSQEQKWAKDVLKQVGVPVTSENLDAMTTWMRFEGGGGGKATGIGKNAANYNPLNTTQGAPGATSMNSVGVKSYLSREQGIEATVQTLENGRYGGILDALKQGNDASAVLAAVSKSPWGTFKRRVATDGTGDPVSGGPQTVNINLTISRASDAEAIAFAKRVKKILLNDSTLSTMGSR